MKEKNIWSQYRDFGPPYLVIDNLRVPSISIEILDLIYSANAEKHA
jgi:hypothetical protein